MEIDNPAKQAESIPPLGHYIAVAQDDAFSFTYPHILADWRNAGAEISTFSPLRNEAPNANADAIYLPGGYPELHAERIANSERFFGGLVSAKERGALIYGECGGYMVLGDGLVDKDGDMHKMAGLLRLETSFTRRKLHLGYRRLKSSSFPLGNRFSAHEFHYTSALFEEGEPLFEAWDATGNAMGKMGLQADKVMGSYLHIIDRVC